MTAATEKALKAIEKRTATVVQRRGGAAGPSTAELLASCLSPCFDSERADEIAAQVDAAGGDFTPIAEAVAGLPVSPAARALRGVLVAAIEAVVGGDARACKAALESIEELLGELLDARRQKWYVRCHGGAAFRPDETAAQVTELELAFFILSWAVREREVWAEWYGGEAVRLYADLCARIESGESRDKAAAEWERRRREAVLPAEEAAVLAAEFGLAADTIAEADALRVHYTLVADVAPALEREKIEPEPVAEPAEPMAAREPEPIQEDPEREARQRPNRDMGWWPWNPYSGG